MKTQTNSNNDRNSELVIDSVISTQPELGPTVSDGGYGWIIFMATLFFQLTIPSLMVSFGIFVAHYRFQYTATNIDETVPLWHDGIVYVPLLFIASWTFTEPSTKMLAQQSTWPRFVSTAGTCLTCAGLLFLWFGLVGHSQNIFFILAGLLTGFGASLQIAQCELLLAQYFKLKYTLLTHITQIVVSLGFIFAPIILGRNISNTNFFNVILWYQAIILQGLVVNLVFKKAPLLKPRHHFTYNPVQGSIDEDEIFSKNAKELQIKRQTSRGSDIERHSVNLDNPEPSSSGITTIANEGRKNWIQFQEDPDLDDFETFNDSDDEISKRKQQWETFGSAENVKSVDLKTEMAKAENTTLPMPIFEENTINYNNTYNFDDVSVEEMPSARESVFMSTSNRGQCVAENLELLKQPTFYKSLIMVITTKYSYFVFYGLFPPFLYERVINLNITQACTFIGVLSVTGLIFALASYWINIDKNRRALSLWFLCLVGSLGYFLLVETNSEAYFIVGAILIIVSLQALQYVGAPLMGLTRRGEMGKEFGLISRLTGLSFITFLFIDVTIEDCFRTMAILHAIVGTIWCCNFIYKKCKSPR